MAGQLGCGIRRSEARFEEHLIAREVRSNMRLHQVQDSLRFAVVAALVLSMLACGEESMRGLFVGYTAHERYEQSLKQAGIDQTALGHQWLAAASRALEQPVDISSPYREVSYLDAREVLAVGYRISLQRGQKLTARFESESDSSYRVFLDMFVIANGSSGDPVLLTSADSLQHEVEYIARRDGEYVVRIQPELLRGGRYEITVVTEASLVFPVSGYDTTAIKSWFGDSRDGGSRDHQGIDIFASRGTPVIAAAKGIVRSTRWNNLGGRVVWLNDDLGRSLYYAHLDSQVVRRGDLVDVGDTLGFVGNTGNARTTPPHLHFGIYQRGPVDPYPAIYQPPTDPATFSGDASMIGKLARVSRDRARVRSLPDTRSPVVAELPVYTPIQIAAGSGGWYRVSLPDGSTGFVAAQLTESIGQPIRSAVIADGGVLLSQPQAAADQIEDLAAGSEVPVLGTYGRFMLVQSPSGLAGWLSL